MFGSFGLLEIALLVLIVVVVFGGRRIGEMIGGFGQGIGAFKRNLRDEAMSDGEPHDRP